MDVAQLVGNFDDGSLREKLQICKHFLVDSEMENRSQRVIIFWLGEIGYAQFEPETRHSYQ